MPIHIAPLAAIAISALGEAGKGLASEAGKKAFDEIILQKLQSDPSIRALARAVQLDRDDQRAWNELKGLMLDALWADPLLRQRKSPDPSSDSQRPVTGTESTEELQSVVLQELALLQERLQSNGMSSVIGIHEDDVVGSVARKKQVSHNTIRQEIANLVIMERIARAPDDSQRLWIRPTHSQIKAWMTNLGYLCPVVVVADLANPQHRPPGAYLNTDYAPICAWLAKQYGYPDYALLDRLPSYLHTALSSEPYTEHVVASERYFVNRSWPKESNAEWTIRRRRLLDLSTHEHIDGVDHPYHFEEELNVEAALFMPSLDRSGNVQRQIVAFLDAQFESARIGQNILQRDNSYDAAVKSLVDIATLRLQVAVNGDNALWVDWQSWHTGVRSRLQTLVPQFTDAAADWAMYYVSSFGQCVATNPNREGEGGFWPIAPVSRNVATDDPVWTTFNNLSPVWRRLRELLSSVIVCRRVDLGVGSSSYGHYETGWYRSLFLLPTDAQDQLQKDASEAPPLATWRNKQWIDGFDLTRLFGYLVDLAREPREVVEAIVWSWWIRYRAGLKGNAGELPRERDSLWIYVPRAWPADRATVTRRISDAKIALADEEASSHAVGSSQVVGDLENSAMLYFATDDYTDKEVLWVLSSLSDWLSRDEA